MKKYACLFGAVIILFSCTNKHFEKKMVLKSLPAVVRQNHYEANKLKDYAEKLNQIDLDEELALLKDKTEKEKFKYRIVEFKIAYNKCVDKIEEIESGKAKNKFKAKRQLKQSMVELDAIWQYIITNYRI